jgi:hypothetical protein
MNADPSRALFFRLFVMGVLFLGAGLGWWQKSAHPPVPKTMPACASPIDPDGDLDQDGLRDGDDLYIHSPSGFIMVGNQALPTADLKGMHWDQWMKDGPLSGFPVYDVKGTRVGYGVCVSESFAGNCFYGSGIGVDYWCNLTAQADRSIMVDPLDEGRAFFNLRFKDGQLMPAQ